MNAFTIEPFVGALPIRFGMTPAEVEAELGPPQEVLPNPFGHRGELRDTSSIGYSATDNRVVEIVFRPGARVSFDGHDIFSDPEIIGFFRRYDPVPYLFVGFIIFPKLGIRLSGFHDGDETQKAVAVAAKGQWDEYADDFEPYGPDAAGSPGQAARRS
jgi:hypothetical protein